MLYLALVQNKMIDSLSSVVYYEHYLGLQHSCAATLLVGNCPLCAVFQMVLHNYNANCNNYAIQNSYKIAVSRGTLN